MRIPRSVYALEGGRTHRRGALLERESLGSTALGHGVAFPHGRWRSPSRVRRVGRPLQPRESLRRGGRHPVDAVFLYLAPQEDPEQFCEIGQPSRSARTRARSLLIARTPEQVSGFDELDQPATGRLDDLARMSSSWRDREDEGILARWASSASHLAIAQAARERAKASGRWCWL